MALGRLHRRQFRHAPGGNELPKKRVALAGLHLLVPAVVQFNVFMVRNTRLEVELAGSRVCVCYAALDLFHGAAIFWHIPR